MKLSTATAISCAIVVFATAASETWAGGRSGGRSGGRGASHSGSKSHPHHGRRTTVVVGSGFYYGPAWWYPVPYYAPQPVYLAPEPPPVYIQQGDDPETLSWYYCESSRAYYPYVGECAEGWQRVVPDLTPQTPSG